MTHYERIATIIAKPVALQTMVLPKNEADIAFRRDITKLVLDKLLIGIVILCLGLVGSCWLEKFKTRETFVSELNKKRVEKISEIWEKVYDYEVKLQTGIKTVDEMKRALSRDTPPPVLDPDMSDAERDRMIQEYYRRTSEVKKPLETGRQEINDLIEIKRFWLSTEDYNNIGAYLNAADKYLSVTIDRSSDAASIHQAQAQREQLRATIASTLQKLLTE